MKEILKKCYESLVKVTILPIYCMIWSKLFNFTGPQPTIGKFGLMALLHFKQVVVFLHFPLLPSCMRIIALKIVNMIQQGQLLPPCT